MGTSGDRPRLLCPRSVSGRDVLVPEVLRDRSPVSCCPFSWCWLLTPSPPSSASRRVGTAPQPPVEDVVRGQGLHPYRPVPLPLPPRSPHPTCRRLGPPSSLLTVGDRDLGYGTSLPLSFSLGKASWVELALYFDTRTWTPGGSVCDSFPHVPSATWEFW